MYTQVHKELVRQVTALTPFFFFSGHRAKRGARGFGAGAKPPGSTFKLVTAIAALNKDPNAKDWTYQFNRSEASPFCSCTAISRYCDA